MQRIGILLLFAFFPPGFARAAEQWLRLTTPHFEMLTTAGEKKGREGILYFENVRQFFVDAKIAPDLPGKRVRIVAFRSDKEFRPYSPNEFAAAFYAGGADNDYIVLSQIGLPYYPVAVHEYTHLLLRHGTVNLPIWLNEGLAEVFSTLAPGRQEDVRRGDHSACTSRSSFTAGSSTWRRCSRWVTIQSSTMNAAMPACSIRRAGR